MERVRVGLDWTPNTTHVGLYAALCSGAFSSRGLEVEFVAPGDDGAPTTPGVGLVAGLLQFGLCPCDQLVSSNFRDELLAVAVLIAKDISAVVVRSDSQITRPRELAGRTYASCGYPFEAATVNELIAADGGSGGGGVREVCPPLRTSTESMLRDGSCDAAWQYLPWEVLRLEAQGVGLRCFRLADFGVAFGYMSSIAVTREMAKSRPELVRRFVEAVAEGTRLAAQDPDAAARMLYEGSAHHADLADMDFNSRSVRKLVELGALGGDGRADPAVWAGFASLLRAVSLKSAGVGEAEAEVCTGERAVWTNKFFLQPGAE